MPKTIEHIDFSIKRTRRTLGMFLHSGDQDSDPFSANETAYQSPSDFAGEPIEADIGGLPATVLYHGRSLYPGLDQVNAVVPPGIYGSNVSVVVVAGGFPGNVGTIPVASEGQICSDEPLIPLSPDEYQNLLSRSSVNTVCD